MKEKLKAMVDKCKSTIGCSSCSCSTECRVWVKVLCAVAVGVVVGVVVL
jgi:hypothetical protein